MRTPESYSFGSVLKSALNPQGESVIEKAKKSAAQKEAARLSRMRNQITDTIEEFNRHLDAGAVVDAIEEALFAAKDFMSAAKRLEKLPLDSAESVDALIKCSEAVEILVETVQNMMGPNKDIEDDDIQYVAEQMITLHSIFDAAYKTFDEATARIEREIGQ
jgi:oligoendopeptidase F